MPSRTFAYDEKHEDMLSQRQEFLLISAAISFSVERCEPLRFGRTRTAQIGWRIVWSDFTTSKPSQDKGTCRRDDTEDWLISLGFTGNRILNSEDPTFGENSAESMFPGIETVCSSTHRSEAGCGTQVSPGCCNRRCGACLEWASHRRNWPKAPSVPSSTGGRLHSHSHYPLLRSKLLYLSRERLFLKLTSVGCKAPLRFN